MRISGRTSRNRLLSVIACSDDGYQAREVEVDKNAGFELGIKVRNESRKFTSTSHQQLLFKI